MGVTYRVHCQQCGHHRFISLGAGFAYPRVYADTLKAAKRGDFGEDIKAFFDEHPDGVIDASSMIAQCENCGDYHTAPSLKMYIPDEMKMPKQRSAAPWSVATSFHGVDYVTRRDLEIHFRLYKEHTHTCKNCGGKMNLIDEEDIEKLKCPNCKDMFLVAEVYMCWD